MTRKAVIKFWQKMSFWNKLRLIILPFALGGEATLILCKSWVGWQIITPIATLAALYINVLFTDKDDDGKVDIFQDK